MGLNRLNRELKLGERQTSLIMAATTSNILISLEAKISLVRVDPWPKEGYGVCGGGKFAMCTWTDVSTTRAYLAPSLPLRHEVPNEMIKGFSASAYNPDHVEPSSALPGTERNVERWRNHKDRDTRRMQMSRRKQKEWKLIRIA
jgi:hypothetical protein